MAKTVGIMGGMGPLATVDMLYKIINHTEARKDQEHLHIIIDDYPQIPDRTTAILGLGQDPTPYMIESAQLLERAGADLIIMACNTAHYYIHAVQKKVSIPVLDMQKETACYARQQNLRKVGLLATDGTLKAKLYQRAFNSENITVLVPDNDAQSLVMKGIYSIKAGDMETGFRLLVNVAECLITDGAEAIIAGCTEVPLVLKTTEKIKIIDPTEILAKSVIQAACTEN